MSYRYLLSGVLVTSDVPLPCVPTGDGVSSDAVAFHLEPAAEPAPNGAEPWDERDSGLAVARVAGQVVLRASAYADFVLDATASSVRCVPHPGCPEAIATQLFVDQVFPLVLHARGRFAFHASSVRLSSGAVVGFLGRSGLGKSTLAASFATSGEHTLFGDDCLAIVPDARGLTALPSYTSARLWPASAEALFGAGGELPFVSPRSDKRRAELADPRPREGAPLACLYLLAEAEAPRIAPLRRAAALVALTSHVYRLDPGDRARLAQELAWLEAIVRAVPVAELAYPRSFAALAAVHAAVVRDVERVS